MKHAWLLVAACASAPPPRPPPPPGNVPPPPPTEAELRAEITVKKGWIGVELDHDEPRVMAIVPGGPGDKVHLQIGDELLALDGVALYTPGDLPTRILASKVGDKVKLHVRRAGKELDLVVTLEEHADQDVIRDKTLVDHPAPAFAATALDGANIGLAGLAGHVAVVDFWATWCGPCRATVPKLEALHAKYADLRVVGISTEDEADLRPFATKYKLTYTIARDPDGLASGHYLVSAIPMLVVIDKQGVVRDVEIGVGDFDALEAKLVELMK